MSASAGTDTLTDPEVFTQLVAEKGALAGAIIQQEVDAGVGRDSWKNSAARCRATGEEETGDDAERAKSSARATLGMRLSLDDIDQIMRGFRGLADECRIEGFERILQQLPQEHMVAQIALVGQFAESVKEELGKRYQEHLRKMSEEDPQVAVDAALVARTLLLLLHGRRGRAEARETVPALWKRMFVIPCCLCSVVFGLFLRWMISNMYLFVVAVSALIAVGGWALMQFLGEGLTGVEEDEEDYAFDHVLGDCDAKIDATPRPEATMKGEGATLRPEATMMGEGAASKNSCSPA